MAAAVRFLIERLRINGNNVGGITSLEVDPAIQAMLDSGSSQLDPSTLFIPRMAPLFRFRTMDVKTVLDLMFTGGNIIPHIPLSSNFDAYLQAASDGGTRGGAGTNQILRATKGVVVPRRISGVAPAILECDVLVDWDGSNAPIQKLTAQNLQAGTPAPAAIWRAASLKNGSAGSILSHLDAWEMDFGIEVIRHEQANAPYPTDTALSRFAPQLQFTTKDCAVALAASGFSGGVAASGGLIAYLAPYDTNTLFPATTGGITLTLLAGSPFYPTAISCPGNDRPATVAYRCHGKGGDTIASPPMTYATAVAIAADSTTAATFVLGPVKHNTTEIEVSSWDCDFGQAWRVDGAAAIPWPNSCFIVERQPKIRVTSLDHANYAALGNAGTVISTAFHVYMRKMDADSEPTPDATASHVKISFTSGWITPGRTGGGHRDSIEPGFEVRATSGNVTLATGSAIT